MATFARTFLRCSSTAALIAAIATTCSTSAHAQDKKKHVVEDAPAVPSYYGPQPATEDIDLTMYARIRTEGFTHGKVMQFGAALADGIGPRLTGSPNMAKANAWTRDTLTAIGLENAHLEDWGEFGMGWQQINTWARMVSPDPEPLWMQAAPCRPPPRARSVARSSTCRLPIPASSTRSKANSPARSSCSAQCAPRRTSPSRSSSAIRMPNLKQ